MMKPGRSLFLIAAISVAACGGQNSPGAGTGAGGAAGGSHAGSAGNGAGGAATGGGAGGATAAGTGGASAGAGGAAGPGAGGARGTGLGGAQGMGGRAGASGDAGPPSGADPIIPPVSGDCPTFATGTVTVAGLAGITLQVGPKSQGTGPLLFYWHGTGQQASEVNALVPAAVRQEIMSQGGIIVSFQGSLGTGGDCSGTATFSRDDFKVADQIAACAVRDYGISPRRIFTTGCSAGGLQAGCMGAMRSSYIAAVAPNSGGEVTNQTIQDPTRVPAVMTMHGGASDMVIVSFATTSATYDTEMKAAGSFVINCDHGGGHCQAPAALYTAAWQFMKDHPFGVAPEPYSSMIPATFPNYCAAF